LREDDEAFLLLHVMQETAFAPGAEMSRRKHAFSAPYGSAKTQNKTPGARPGVSVYS
jgi:hypothetical protein